MLRNALKSARVDGLIKTLPVEDIQWQRTEGKPRCPPQACPNGVRSIGGEASLFFKLATDWSSILSVRAETACGGTSTRRSSRQQPLARALTWKYFLLAFRRLMRFFRRRPRHGAQ